MLWFNKKCYYFFNVAIWNCLNYHQLAAGSFAGLCVHYCKALVFTQHNESIICRAGTDVDDSLFKALHTAAWGELGWTSSALCPLCSTSPVESAPVFPLQPEQGKGTIHLSPPFFLFLSVSYPSAPPLDFSPHSRHSLQSLNQDSYTCRLLGATKRCGPWRLRLLLLSQPLPPPISGCDCGP